MADTFSEAKEHDRHSEENFYNIGDIVELRKPKGILGCIKYIGPKLNGNGDLISSDVHYVIQLEEYVGNGNGKWNGYQYIQYLRPDKTMHLCKYNNIRCKRSSDDILKALYNILRTNNKLQQQIKQQQNYINDLQNINYKFEQHLQSQKYYTTKQLLKNNNNGNNNNNILSSHSSSDSCMDNSCLDNDEINESMDMEEISERVRSEKWVTLSNKNILDHNNNNNNNNNNINPHSLITPPPNYNHNHNNNHNVAIPAPTHNKFNNSLTIDSLQLQKARRSHRRNQSEDYEYQQINKPNINNHRHVSQTAYEGLFNNEITPAPPIENIEHIENNNDENMNVNNNDDEVAIGEYITNSNVNVNVKQKRKDIKQGNNNVNTHGKLQLYQRGIEKQKSMDKMKSAKVVNSKVNAFEKMIKENSVKNNKMHNENSHQSMTRSNDIGNYDDRTMVIHPDQLIQSDQ